MRTFQLIPYIKINFLLCIAFLFSGNINAQLTYVTCNSTCPSTLVGHVTFANKTGTTTGRWTVNDLSYGGLTNESFYMRDPASYTFTNGDLTSTGGGTYTIVSNPSTVNGPTSTPLQNKATDGVFLYRPNDNANAAAVYKITGLKPGDKYCVRVKMRNAAKYLDCNQSLYTTIQFRSLTGLNISGGGVSGGTWTRVENNAACNQTTSGSWDGNNQTYGLMWDEYASWYECNFQLGQNPNNTNDDGFTLNFQANAWGNNDVWGIDEIEVYGCITQQILSSAGTSICEGTPTTLTAQGIGSTTDTYSWEQSINGGGTWTPISSTANKIDVTPGVATMYRVTGARTNLTVNTTVTPVNCCGPTGLFTIPKVCEPITVDGTGNEPVWYAAPWQTVTKPLALGGNQDCILTNASCAGVQENPAGQWRAIYTATDIFFNVRIEDPAPQNSGVYYQDAVEIYIANNANQPLQFGYTYANGTPGFYNSNGAINGMARVVKNATSWDLEVRIPLATNNINLSSGYLRMELGINQAKTGCNNCRAAQLFTWTAANHYSGTTQYHTAPLSDCAGVTSTNKTVCNGGSSVLSTQLSTINAGLPYAWEQSINAGVNWSTVPGTTNTITVSPTVQTMYRAIYDNVRSCPDTISIGTINLVVTNPPAVCSPATIDLTAAAVTAGSEAGLTYSYFTDATATTTLANPAAVSTGGTYYIKGQSSSCFGVKPVAVTINTGTVPTFATINPICQGKVAPTLPTTSSNNIPGTWTPSSISTTTPGTTTYTFTPATGQCATTKDIQVTIDPAVTPAFATIGALCQGAPAPTLSTTSTNNITGTWNPSTVSTATVGTTNYTFTPAASQCAKDTTLSITVTSPSTVPLFDPIDNVCQGAPAPTLPTISKNSITGTWSPAVSTATTGTKTYTFTPATGQCAAGATLAITVDPVIAPLFASVADVCINSTPPTLPTTSSNNITGTWSPAVSTATAGTTTYTFTPASGQCASSTTLPITVASSITPAFDPIADVCVGATPPTLPTTSTNNITGTWNAAVSTATSGTTVYTFTPNGGQCATATTNLSVTVFPPPTPTFAPIANVCVGATNPILPSTSLNNISGTWLPAVSTATAGTTIYNFIPSTGQCATTTTLSITVDPPTEPIFDPVASVCVGATAPILPTTSNNGFSGTWSPAIISTATAGTTTYTFIPTTGQCAAQTTLPVTVNVAPLAPTVAANPLNICQNATPVQLSATGNNLTWYDLAGVTSVAPTPLTTAPRTFTYQVSASNGTCESAKTQLVVNINPVSAYAGGPVIKVDEGVSTQINGTATGNGMQILWTPSLYLSNSTIANPSIIALTDATYTMKVTTIEGCVASDNLQVIILRNLKIPNVFSPNGDGINDTWDIEYMEDYTNAKVSIFNRYGQFMFEAAAGSYNGKPWDGTNKGKPLPIGTYFYIIDLGEGKMPISGSVSIIR